MSKSLHVNGLEGVGGGRTINQTQTNESEIISVYLPECICAWCAACINGGISIRKAQCVMDEPEGSRVDGQSFKPVKIKFFVKIVDFLIKGTLICEWLSRILC